MVAGVGRWWSAPLGVDYRYLSGTSTRRMEEHEAVFEIESKADAYAVERLLVQLYDTVREEVRTRRTESSDVIAVL